MHVIEACHFRGISKRYAKTVIWIAHKDTDKTKQVDRRYAVPMVAIGVVSGCAGLVGLIQLGSSVVLQIVTSILVEGFLGSSVVLFQSPEKSVG